MVGPRFKLSAGLRLGRRRKRTATDTDVCEEQQRAGAEGAVTTRRKAEPKNQGERKVRTRRPEREIEYERLQYRGNEDGGDEGPGPERRCQRIQRVSTVSLREHTAVGDLHSLPRV